MRLDKFLKVSRLIKRRTLAKEVCENGRCMLNGRVAKAGSEVHEGDLLAIRFGQRIIEVKIEQLQETARKDLAAQMYNVVSETKSPSGTDRSDEEDGEDEEDDL
ncbi:RNA-binding S4 domain-containing protein [Fodinisporobacter ferrooxydans]|uniref:RQC P-site tRNA stabilizing factor n=1 Tax=Fodinisporobacter ferrooxydans TaxID=2901836 RepID=A0ABY4CQX9_9BACL|nr:RNA-binding S4 domain-containing protein [Alicyclobacillaceae bacterium MYW30-H2]